MRERRRAGNAEVVRIPSAKRGSMPIRRDVWRHAAQLADDRRWRWPAAEDSCLADRADPRRWMPRCKSRSCCCCARCSAEFACPSSYVTHDIGRCRIEIAPCPASSRGQIVERVRSARSCARRSILMRRPAASDRHGRQNGPAGWKRYGYAAIARQAPVNVRFAPRCSLRNRAASSSCRPNVQVGLIGSQVCFGGTD